MGISIDLLLSLMLFFAAGQRGEPAGQKGGDIPSPYVEKSEKQFSFYPGGKLEISAASPGNFKIVGWQNASIRVEMEKVFFYLSPEQAQAASSRYPVHITYTATSAKISTAGPPQPAATMEVNIVVYVPGQKTDVSIKMIQGDLSVSFLNGQVEATLEQGNVEARDLAGYFSALTKLGDLNVELSGKNWRGYGLTGGTTRGSVSLRLPSDYSAAIQLETKDGEISIDYPEQMVQGESVPLQIMGRDNARSVSSPIGSGGALIRLMTVSGNILLQKK